MSPTSRAADALRTVIADVVVDARAAPTDGWAEPLGRLAPTELERVGVLAAATSRSLLEESFPDGLDADDVRAVLTRCAQDFSRFEGFDPDAILLVLSSALGTLDPASVPPIGRTDLARHAMLVIADLSGARPGMLDDHLDAAIAEIRRAETMEMP